MVLFDIEKTFCNVGEQILSVLCRNNNYGITAKDLYQGIADFKQRYLEYSYQHYLGNLSFEEYIQEELHESSTTINEMIHIFYEHEAQFWDRINSENNRYGDLDTNKSPKMIEAARKEIEWRQEYIKNPRYNSLILNLRNICERIILDIISYTSRALNLNLNLTYFTWESYQSCLKKIVLLQDNKTQNRKSLAIDALKNFPFERMLYKYILHEFGDANGAVTALSNFFELDTECFKKDLLDAYISSLPTINMDEETELSKQLQTIKEQKYFLGYDNPTPKESELQKRLQELDILLRTVRGVVYETREEAEKVKNDYSLLMHLIKNIDFNSYNLLNQNEVVKVKNNLLANHFESDTFRSNPDCILNELNPMLDHNIQKQEWKERLYKSTEPWIVVEEIIRESNILPEYKNKFTYWNFAGFKKYYPILLRYERPVLFFQISLFGWSNYFVLTNKRGIYISKNTQSSVLIDETTVISYQNGQLLFNREGKNDTLAIPMKYSENNTEYLTEVLTLIANSLCKNDETLFEVPPYFYPDMTSVASAEDIFSRQLKGLFQDKVSPFLKNTRKSINNFLSDSNEPLSKDTPEIRYCPQCGVSVNRTDKFCSMCGNKLR